MTKDKPFDKTQGKLNNRQHRFCLNILAGMRPQEAYANAGYSDNPVNLATRPYDILQEAPQVKAFIEEKRRLKEAVILAGDVNATIALPQERKQILSALARHGIELPVGAQHKIAAIAEINKMDGSYAPSKHLVGKIQYNISFVDKVKERDDESI